MRRRRRVLFFMARFAAFLSFFPAASVAASWPPGWLSLRVLRLPFSLASLSGLFFLALSLASAFLQCQALLLLSGGLASQLLGLSPFAWRAFWASALEIPVSFLSVARKKTCCSSFCCSEPAARACRVLLSYVEAPFASQRSLLIGVTLRLD